MLYICDISSDDFFSSSSKVSGDFWNLATMGNLFFYLMFNLYPKLALQVNNVAVTIVSIITNCIIKILGQKPG